jgi:hypothetical protein
MILAGVDHRGQNISGYENEVRQVTLSESQSVMVLGAYETA